MDAEPDHGLGELIRNEPRSHDAREGDGQGVPSDESGHHEERLGGRGKTGSGIGQECREPRQDDGGDPGAPVKPNLKKKLLTTTYIAAGIWVLVMIIIQFGLIPLPEFPG